MLQLREANSTRRRPKSKILFVSQESTLLNSLTPTRGEQIAHACVNVLSPADFSRSKLLEFLPQHQLL